MSSPRITVVVPVHNCEDLVGEAVVSILDQGHHDLEVIVVDDGSTDGTARVLAGFGERIRVLTQPNQGPGAARNAGIRAATGELIGLLDADDLWPTGRIAAMLPHVADAGGYDVCRGTTRQIGRRPDGTYGVQKELVLPALVGACLFRRAVFDRAGLFNEGMRFGQDFDWNLRLAESGCREKRIDLVTLIYRRHGANTASSNEAIKRGLFDSIRNKLARERSAGSAGQS